MPVPLPSPPRLLRQAAGASLRDRFQQGTGDAHGAAIIVSVALGFRFHAHNNHKQAGYGLGKADGSGSSAALRLTIGDLVHRRNPQRRFPDQPHTPAHLPGPAR